MLHPHLQEAFAQRRALKIISGLNNFDRDRVAAVARAATAGGATFIDLAASPELVGHIRSLTDLPICVSAVEPQAFVPAVAAGAECIEVGNFDSFYAAGRRFEAAEVVEITRATRELLPEICLSVTVPHILPLDEQVALAEELVALGADIIQTEGGTSSHPAHGGVLGLMEKAAPTLAAAYTIARAVEVPVLCASGLSAVTAPLAIASGAAGIGVGSAVNRLEDEVAMVAAVRGLAEALAQSTVRV